VQTALKAALQEAELTKRLLAFSRAQSAAPATVVDLNRLVREMLDLIQRTLGPSVKVEPRLAEDLWLARLDSNEFENVLLNLVLNARDAMPRGGQLTLVTKNHVLDATGARNLGEDVAAGEYVALSVSDTGTGMPPEVQARMFEPFFTTKPRELGTGLGLAMVQTFVKHGKGYIKLDSQPGRGTTIQLGLPRAQAQAAQARPAESAALPTGHETILVVEDETALLEVAVTCLTDLGYRALPAADVATALDILHREKNIDLLFTDVVMPGVTDGIALAEAARIFLPDIKVLFTSAFPKQGLEAREGRVLEVPLLGKPYRKAELAREIRNALDGRGGASRAI
jgi:CheY-like chemotaxis protein